MTPAAAHARYFARRAAEALARAPRATAVAVLTVAVAVFLTGLFAGALRAGERVLVAWAGDVRIAVYLDAGADLAAARAAALRLAPGRAVEAISAEEALRRFRDALGPERALADGVAPGVLPPSVEVRAPGLALADARALAARLAEVPGAREVDFGGAWLEAAERALARLRRWGGLLLAALALGAAVLVGNTLRLGVLARRDELELLRLVGATDAFVRTPFLLEGAAQGLAGGLAAVAALAGVAAAAAPRLAAAAAMPGGLGARELLPRGLAAALVLGGAALGLAASALAVGHELGREG